MNHSIPLHEVCFKNFWISWIISDCWFYIFRRTDWRHLLRKRCSFLISIFVNPKPLCNLFFAVQRPAGRFWSLRWSVLRLLPAGGSGRFGTSWIQGSIFFRISIRTTMCQPGQQRQRRPLRWLPRFSRWPLTIRPLLCHIHTSFEFDTCPLVDFW